MTKNYIDLTVGEGKYRFVQESSDSPLTVLRYGNPWVDDLRIRELQGCNAIMAAILELEEIKNNADTDRQD